MKAAIAYRLGGASRRSHQLGELVKEHHADGSIVIAGQVIPAVEYLERVLTAPVSSPLHASGCYFCVPSDRLTTVTSRASRLAQGRSMSNHSVVLLYFARTCFR